MYDMAIRAMPTRLESGNIRRVAKRLRTLATLANIERIATFEP
jgi:hypothetical protein